MRPTQLLNKSLLCALCALAAAQDGVPRRGPPRGPIKEDKSTFFGKEGDQAQREASPFTQFALTGCALLLVGLGLLQIFGTMVTVKARDAVLRRGQRAERAEQCTA